MMGIIKSKTFLSWCNLIGAASGGLFLSEINEPSDDYDFNLMSVMECHQSFFRIRPEVDIPKPNSALLYKS